MLNRIPKLEFGLAVIIILHSAAPLSAVDSAWKSGGPSTDWYEPLNWTTGVPQNVGDVARFNNATPIVTRAQLNAPATLTQLFFNGRGSFEITGAGPLSFTDPGVRSQPLISVQAQSGASNELSTLINVPIVIPDAEALTIALANRSSIRLHGVISGDGGVSYTGRPTGFGSEIRGQNSYSGLTTVDVGLNYHFDVVTPTAFGDETRETILRSGRLSLWEGTAEAFIVEQSGILIPTSSTGPYTGRITLAGGVLLPSSRFTNEDDLTVEMDSEISIRGRGYIGLSPYAGSNAELTGPITGGGLLVFQGSTSETISTLGAVQHRGDVLGADRANVIVAGEFRPAGDLKVDGGISSGRIRLGGDTSGFAGDIETRLGFLTVGTTIHTDHLKVDARLATWRESLQRGGVTIEPGATLDADALEFYAGNISGRLTGVDQILKQTRIAASLSRLEDYAGVIAVEEGFLDIRDAGGLGTAAGQTEVIRQRGAAIALYQSARVEDAIYLNNASGFDYGGALLGPGDMAGQLHLGDQGAYIGGYGGTLGTFERSGNLRVSGSIHGGALYKTGSHTDLIVSGANHTYSGDTNVLGGQLILTENGRLDSTSAIRVGSGRVNTSGQPTATLLLDDRGAIRSQDRVADDVPVHLSSGRLELQGIANQSRETVGLVSLDGGWNRVYATGGVLRIDELERNPGAVVSFLPSSSARIEVGAAALDDNVLGGWALYHQEEYRPQGFATLAAGVIQNASAVMQSLNVSTATQNVHVTAPDTLTHDVTVNSLKTRDNAPIDLAGHRLTVDSGGILALGETTINNGSLTAGPGGPSELFLHNYWNLAVGANVIDNGGPLTLHVSGIGFVNLSGANTYTGGTRITQSSGIHVLSRSAVPAGDVVDIDSGRYMIDFSDGQPLQLERLILRGSASVEGSSTTAIDANYYEAYSGWIYQPIAGDGQFIKRGESEVALDTASVNYVGPILVEQGTLRLPQTIGWTTPSESSAITVREGGALAVVNLPEARLLILEGGELRINVSSNSVPSFPIEVRGGGAITGQGNLFNPIRGHGELVIDGPYDNALTLNRGFNDFDGDVTITGGVVNIDGNSHTFPGLVHIRASGAATTEANAFGPGGGIVHPEGILTVHDALAAPIHLAGGVLRPGTNNAIVHNLNVVADSEIETGESYLSSTPTPINMQTTMSATFADGVRLKKTGPGRLTLNGILSFGENVEIVAWEGEVELRGAINAKPGSSLNFIGNDNLVVSGPLYLPAGSSFQLQTDGVPQELRFASASARLTGLGTVLNDVDIRNNGVLSPGPGVGKLSVDGDLTLGPTARYEWELVDPAGAPGASTGWDLIEVGGALAFDNAPWVLTIYSANLPAATVQPASAPGPGSQQWLIASAADITGLNPAAVTIDATHLILKRPEYAHGRFSVLADGGDLYAVYTIPEPASIAMAASNVLAMVLVRRCGKRRHRLSTASAAAR